MVTFESRTLNKQRQRRQQKEKTKPTTATTTATTNDNNGDDRNEITTNISAVWRAIRDGHNGLPKQ